MNNEEYIAKSVLEAQGLISEIKHTLSSSRTKEDVEYCYVLACNAKKVLDQLTCEIDWSEYENKPTEYDMLQSQKEFNKVIEINELFEMWAKKPKHGD